MDNEKQTLEKVFFQYSLHDVEEAHEEVHVFLEEILRVLQEVQMVLEETVSLRLCQNPTLIAAVRCSLMGS